MKKIIFFIVLCLLSINCNYKTLPTLTSDLKNFDKKFVNHFPNEESLELLSYYYTYPKDSIITNLGATLKAKYKIVGNINSLLKKYENNSIKICHHSDSCNIILPIAHFSNNTIEEPILLPCKNNYVPVPNFKVDLLDMNIQENLLPKDFILYVLDAKPGKFIRDGLLYKKGVMPQEWEHGYSKGVAISKQRKIAIYWIKIW